MELCKFNTNGGVWREYGKDGVTFQVNEDWEGNLENISELEENKDEVKLSLYGFPFVQVKPTRDARLRKYIAQGIMCIDLEWTMQNVTNYSKLPCCFVLEAVSPVLTGKTYTLIFLRMPVRDPIHWKLCLKWRC
jgi:hypothetical protein